MERSPRRRKGRFENAVEIRRDHRAYASEPGQPCDRQMRGIWVVAVEMPEHFKIPVMQKLCEHLRLIFRRQFFLLVSRENHVCGPGCQGFAHGGSG